jgi:hypothetical protein
MIAFLLHRKIHESSLVWIEDSFFTLYYKMLLRDIGLIFNFSFVHGKNSVADVSVSVCYENVV